MSAAPWEAHAPSRDDESDGASRRARLVLRIWRAGAVSYACAGLLLAYEINQHIAPTAPAFGLAVFMALGTIGLVALLRVDLSERAREGWLFEAQAGHALLCTAGLYAISGPLRSCALMFLLLTLVFTMFASSRRLHHRVAGAALLLFAATMAAMTRLDAPRYPVAEEAAYFAVLAVVMVAISVLGDQLIRLRERLQRQRSDLSTALQRIQMLATRDDLTGLMNRRQMQEVMTLEHQRCMRSGQPFCVAMLDLDNFKLINDSYGHAAGDEVLRAFAREATAVIRISDVLARWGGEEFVLLMSSTRGPLARQAVERLRERAAALRVRADDLLLQITVSAGVAEHLAGEPLADTLARADRALYAAKSEGRDRVLFH